MRARQFLLPLTLLLFVSIPVTSRAVSPGGAEWIEHAKLTTSDAGESDWFGRSAAISGNMAIIGAPGYYGPGVSRYVTGSAYLFDVTTGNELRKLTASDAALNDFFGYSVAISGNKAIVGAYRDDDAGSDSGSAYLFDVTTGDQLHKLAASDAAAVDVFGYSVAISGNTAIVGARLKNGAGNNSGSAYLFDVTTGNELRKLTASDAAANASFGYSVAISGNKAIVGASGSAYLFDVTTGDQLHKLTASDAGAEDQFGLSVAISDNTAIIGARGDDGGWLEGRGSAYLFDVTTGNQLLRLTASDAATRDHFGHSVAITGNTAIVGAYSDEAGEDSGSAYLFDVTTGDQLNKLTASDAATWDHFGCSVTLSGNTAIVGAYGNGDAGFQSGSAYLFVPEPSTLILLTMGAVGLLAYARRRR